MAAALALPLLSGCAASPPPKVTISEAWPQKPLAYPEAYKRWTRHEKQSDEWTLNLDAEATLHSAEWRAAYVAEIAKQNQLPAEAAARLAAAEEADARTAWQVELVVSTHSLAWNDFGKKDKSMWRVALVGDGGREVLPLTVKEDKRQIDTLRVFYPDMGMFQRAYVVRFPKVAGDGKPLVADGSNRLSLKITSPVSAVELVWSSR